MALSDVGGRVPFLKYFKKVLLKVTQNESF